MRTGLALGMWRQSYTPLCPTLLREVGLFAAQRDQRIGSSGATCRKVTGCLLYTSSEAWDAYVWVDNADELCSEFRAKGAPRTRPDTICAARRRERIGKLHRFGQAPEASLRSGTNAAPVFQRHKRGHDKRCRWHRWQAAQFKGNLGPKSWLR